MSKGWIIPIGFVLNISSIFIALTFFGALGLAAVTGFFGLMGWVWLLETISEAKA